MSHAHALISHHGRTPRAVADQPDNVNARLTAKRPRQPVENDAYAAFARRVLRAHGRRVAAGDIDALQDMADLSAEIDTAMNQAITGLRARGYAWAEIGARLGITRQAAQQRWGQ